MIQILYLECIICDLDLYTITLELLFFDLIRLYHCVMIIICCNLFHYDLIVYFCHVFMIFILFLRFKLLNKRANQHAFIQVFINRLASFCETSTLNTSSREGHDDVGEVVRGGKGRQDHGEDGSHGRVEPDPVRHQTEDE